MSIDELKPFNKLTAGDPFISARLDTLAGAIKQVYLRRGFATVTVRSGVNEVSEAVLRPTIVVAEGPRVLVGTVTIAGNRALKTDDLLRLMDSRSGQPFYAPEVVGDREKIRVEYLNAGFASLQVSVVPAFSADGTRVDLPFKVEEGPQTIVDHILIVGNTRTDRAVIRRELQFHEGQPLGQQALVESQRRLSGLGLFRRVRIAQLQHGTPTNPDVIVTVEEALRTTIGYGGGAEVDSDPGHGCRRPGGAKARICPARLFRDWPTQSLGKKPNRQSLHPAQSSPERQSRQSQDIRVHRVSRGRDVPRAQGGTRQRGPDTHRRDEQGRRTSFNFSRKGVNAELTQRLSDLVRGSLRYSFGTTRTFDERLSEEDKLTIDRLFPQVRLSAFSVAVSRDSRDDLLEPQHGTLVSLDGTLAARAIGSQVGYSKSYLQGFYYHRLGHPRLVFAGGARLGLADP